jgi:hypothetical protein
MSDILNRSHSRESVLLMLTDWGWPVFSRLLPALSIIGCNGASGLMVKSIVAICEQASSSDFDGLRVRFAADAHFYLFALFAQSKRSNWHRHAMMWVRTVLL